MSTLHNRTGRSNSAYGGLGPRVDLHNDALSVTVPAESPALDTSRAMFGTNPKYVGIWGTHAPFPMAGQPEFLGVSNQEATQNAIATLMKDPELKQTITAQVIQELADLGYVGGVDPGKRKKAKQTGTPGIVPENPQDQFNKPLGEVQQTGPQQTQYDRVRQCLVRKNAKDDYGTVPDTQIVRGNYMTRDPNNGKLTRTEGYNYPVQNQRDNSTEIYTYAPPRNYQSSGVPTPFNMLSRFNS